MAGNLIHFNRFALCTPLLVSACSFTAASNNTDATSVDAARADARIDAPPGCNTLTCNGNTLTCETDQEVCAVSCSTTGGAHCTQFEPSNGADWSDLTNVVDIMGDLTLTDGILINSDSGTIETRAPQTTIRGAGEGVINGYRFRVISPQVSLLAFDDLTIASGADVRVTGKHALILFARNSITIIGEIDADGGRDTDPAAAGPGGGTGAVGAAAAAGCGGGPNGGFNAQNQDAGGGAGGSFNRKGGNGGGAELSPTAAAVCAERLSINLQGGSGGGRGGNPTTNGDGGGGGGAIQFTAGLRILTTGLLHAGGAGGNSSGSQGGGGGAGSGGGFLFEAPMVTILATATIMTNGGGGGDGKDVMSNGETGHPDLTVAATAGNGGNGGVTDTAAQNGGGNKNAGSGGGGGGIGKIEIISVNANPIMNGAKVSPLLPTVSVLVGM